VWWQALLYFVSFLVTWPIYFVTIQNPLSATYGLWVSFVILNPLQGWWNALISFRPRLASWYETRQKKRSEKPRGGASPAAAPEAAVTPYLVSDRASDPVAVLDEVVEDPSTKDNLPLDNPPPESGTNQRDGNAAAPITEESTEAVSLPVHSEEA
jgi:hypothetical protein